MSANNAAMSQLKALLFANGSMNRRPFGEPVARPRVPVARVKGPLVGWRWWTVKDGVLYSYNDTRWEGPTLSAHERPTWENSSGLYAFRGADAGWRQGVARPDAAWGKIEFWGRVIEHADGYRAEHATVQKLWVWQVEYEALTPFGWMTEWRGVTDAQRHAMEERYQCPVHVEWRRGGDVVPSNPDLMTLQAWQAQALPQQRLQGQGVLSQLSGLSNPQGFGMLAGLPRLGLW